MKSYTHLTLSERKCLQKLLSKGLSMRKIAAILERSPSTISREVKRNKPLYRPHKKPDNKYWYNYWRAQNLYTRRRRAKVRQALKPETKQWDFICNGLKKFWSPEAICGRWQIMFPDEDPISPSTIYRYIKAKKLPDISARKNLRRRGKRLYSRKTNCNTIHPDRIIPDWEDSIKNRERIGDWEGDTVYGAVGRGLIVTLVDRKSRFLCAGLLSSRDSDETRSVIDKLLSDKPVRSLSLDNGSEFAKFRELEKSLNAPIYFAEPHKPWQRGSNENTNDILRFFFPKGFDFHSLDNDFLQQVVLSINLRPRKCLGWKSPFEVFFGVALA